MKYSPRRLKTNVNVTPTSPLKELAILMGGLLAIVLGIYILLGFAVDLVAPRISVDLEKKLAGPLLHTLEKSATVDDRQPYLQSLIDDLQSRCADLPYVSKIQVIESDMVNAAAMPGGNIFIFTGLLDQVSSENELVFILAHEMGHYAHRDHLKRLGRSLVLLAMAVALFGSDNMVVDLLSRGVNITEMGFSRQQETQADGFGLDMLYCAFGHVGGATDFFTKLSADQDPGRWGHYFASHPENRKRIAHLKKMAADRGYPVEPLTPLPW